MKKIFSLLLLLVSTAVFAQIAIKIEPSQPVFLKYEPIFIRMAMRNYSSHPITFGTADRLRGSVSFELFSPTHYLVSRNDGKKGSLLDGVILAPGESRTFTFNIARSYPLQETGRYSVKAIVRHPQMPSAYESNEIPFHVRSGNVIWSRKFGVPDYTGKNSGKIVEREYKVLTFSNGRNMMYYMMIEDRDRVYKVKRIGFELGSNLKPQMEVDSMARLHIMVAVTSSVYAYYIYDHTGVLEKRTVYIRSSSTPYLVYNPVNATVVVDGGRIARPDIDYEIIKDLPFLDEVKTERPVPPSKP